METVKNALSSQIKFDKARYWLGSMTALFWIYNNAEWKQFVQHRVNEILTLTNKEDWGHVPGTDNPADIGPRGVSALFLKSSNLWWEGPTWLSGSESEWPTFSPQADTADIETERRKNATLMLTANICREGLSNIVDIHSHGTLGKLLRLTAYVLRFTNNLKEKRESREINVESLSTAEIETAEHVWIKDVQDTLQDRQDFQILSRQLGIVKQKSVLVCKGRLQNADLNTNSKYPQLSYLKTTDLLIW